MAFKLTPKIKDLFDIVRALSSYLSIISVGILVFFIFKPFDINEFGLAGWSKILLKIFAALLISSPFMLLFIDWLSIRYVIYKGKLNSHIIECQEVFVDIYENDGKLANIFQKVFFHKVSNKNRSPYYTTLSFSGKVLTKSIQTLNCSYSLSPQHDSVKVSYINDMAKLNKHENVFKENDKFLMLYLTVKNTFTANQESWKMGVSNLCQDYKLEILLPKGKKIKYAKFCRDNEQREVVKNIQPLVIMKNNRLKILLRVMNFDKHEKFILVWEYN